LLTARSASDDFDKTNSTIGIVRNLRRVAHLQTPERSI